jgi:hypothetical protein
MEAGCHRADAFDGADEDVVRGEEAFGGAGVADAGGGAGEDEVAG